MKMIQAPIESICSREHFEAVLEENKGLERQFHILFTSQFDPWSQYLRDQVEENYSLEDPIYIVDSFETPDIFSDFGIRTPYALVTSHVKYFTEETHLPSIYTKLEIG
jgi:hypothetical protein